ncbi:BspA family leucine-rich repeat surface protein [Flavobacteriaceae bacterium]|nr:BspA family leucine-rich repeat surface protein [Flavobacteriaceae bacterium]
MGKKKMFMKTFGSVVNQFIISVKTDNVGTSTDTQFTLPINAGTYDVDWGDTNVDLAQSGTQTHTYSSSGTYDISVSNATQILFNNGGDKLKLLEIKSWGNSNPWTNFRYAFFGCSNMDVTATDSIDFSSMNPVGNQLQSMFRGCTSLVNANQSMNTWDVSSLKKFITVFYECTNFNSPLNNWDTANVDSMEAMFYKSGFNQDVSSWDVSNVVNASDMFFRSDYNQSLAGWDLSSMSAMYNMLRQTPFDQDLSSWNVTGVNSMGGLLQDSTLSTANYDALLIAWDAQGAMSYSGTVNFGGSKYTLGGEAEAARTSLIAKWGGITDGGGVVAPLPLANIISEYKFENNVLDTVGTNDGTPTALTYANGLVNRTGVFNGSANVSLTTLPIPNDEFSISFLAKTSGTSEGRIVGWSNWSGYTRIEFNSGGTLNRIGYVVNDGTGGASIVVDGYDLTDWIHIVVTAKANNSSKIYVNGVYGNGNLSLQGFVSIAGNNYIGSNRNGNASLFQGDIDCVRIWNKELSPVEITLLATDELAGIDINP